MHPGNIGGGKITFANDFSTFTDEQSAFLHVCYRSGVVATLAKNVKTCVLRLTSTKLCFVISERGLVGGINIWCELTQVIIHCSTSKHILYYMLHIRKSAGYRISMSAWVF